MERMGCNLWHQACALLGKHQPVNTARSSACSTLFAVSVLMFIALQGVSLLPVQQAPVQTF